MKKGFLGFLTGTVIGGFAAMLTSKRAGKEVRQDLAKAWKSGKTGGEVVVHELKDLADEAKKGIDDFRKSEYGQKAEKELKKAYSKVSKNVSGLVEEAKKDVSGFVKTAKKGIETKKKEIVKKVTEKLPKEETAKPAVKKPAKRKAASKKKSKPKSSSKKAA